MKILHIINSLNVGGAEKMLLKLVNSSQFQDDEIIVVTLLDQGKLAPLFEHEGHKVFSLNLNGGFRSIFSACDLFALIKDFRPNIIQSWLYQSDLAAGIIGLITRTPVVWGLRQSNLSPAVNKLTTRICIRLCSFFSWFLPAQIISNSVKAKDAHVSFGYDKKKICQIPNGFDTDFFMPSDKNRKISRKALGVDQHHILIGMIGRYDSVKNHEGFLEAASIVLRNFPCTHFCLVGEGVNSENKMIKHWISANPNFKQNIHLLGARNDINELLSSFDILAVPSFGESFPNVVGEAMACGVPCVSNNVGDCTRIIEDTGLIVSSFKPIDFAKALIEMISLSRDDRAELGVKARERIISYFSISKCAGKFRSTYLKIISDKQG